MKNILHLLGFLFLSLGSIHNSIDQPTISNKNHTPWQCSHDHTTIEESLCEGLSETTTRAEQLRINENAALNQALASSGQKLKIPVVAHRFNTDCIFTGWTASISDIVDEIYYTNEVYDQNGLNIELVLLEIYEHYNDSAIVYLNVLCDQSQGYYEEYDQDFWDLYGVEGAINLFCVDNDSPSAQHAYFPTVPSSTYGYSLPNMIILKYYNEGWSTMHELGHTFNLYHTFENLNGVENKTRDPMDPCYNADTHGDMVADTDATINLNFLNGTVVDQDDPNCDLDQDCDCTFSYINPPTDNCGETLDMSNDIWGNVMNYGSRDCSRIFTPGQVDRMWDGILLKISLGQIDFCHLDAPDNCPLFLSLSGSVDVPQYLRSKLDIFSSQTINPSNQKSVFKAKTTYLTPGFLAKEGVQLDVEVDACDCQ